MGRTSRFTSNSTVPEIGLSSGDEYVFNRGANDETEDLSPGQAFDFRLVFERS